VSRHLSGVVRSAVFVFAVFVLLWPVGAVLPRWLSYLPQTAQGDGPILIALLTLSGIAGVVAAAVLGARPRHLAVGGCLSYVVAMVAIEAVFDPISPVHLILYGLLLVGVVLGSVVGSREGL